MAFTALFTATLATASDSGAPPTVAEILRCAAVGSPTERLACYDSIGARVRGVKDSQAAKVDASTVASAKVTPAAIAPPTPAATPATTANERSPEAKVVPDVKPPTYVGQAARQADRPVDRREELNDTVAKLEVTPLSGAWIITLSNGQVWNQTVPDRFNLKVGYSVHIYPSKWGTGYRLSAREIHGFIQVEPAGKH